MPQTLDITADSPANIIRINGFISKTDEEIAAYHASMGFAMSVADLCWVRDYFKTEGRDPSLTELKVIDTYWSDHCRHTTFGTKLDEITIEKSKYGKAVEAALEQYFALRHEVYGERESKKMFALWTWLASEQRRSKSAAGFPTLMKVKKSTLAQ